MGAAIVWGSEQQTCIALSTCEAELVALSRAVQEVIFIRKLLGEFLGGGTAASPTFVFCDNKGTLDLVENNKHHKRTKHIETRYFYARDMQEKQHVQTAKVSSALNISDGFTKAVDEEVVKDHRFALHGMDQEHVSGEIRFRKVPNPSGKAWAECGEQ